MRRHNVFYNADYVSSEYAFDTTRKSGALAAVLEEDGSADVVDPGQFTERTEGIIDRLHSLDYVQAVRTGTPSGLAESQGFEWDPKLPSMAIAHSTGLVAAVAAVLTADSRVAGSLSSGLHHARRDRGAGYCTFNGLAVAATDALERGAERILVLDFDAHCGGGTRSMTSSDEVVQIDVSTVMFDSWPPSAAEDSLTHSGPDQLHRRHRSGSSTCQPRRRLRPGALQRRDGPRQQRRQHGRSRDARADGRRVGRRARTTTRVCAGRRLHRRRYHHGRTGCPTPPHGRCVLTLLMALRVPSTH